MNIVKSLVALLLILGGLVALMYWAVDLFFEALAL